MAVFAVFGVAQVFAQEYPPIVFVHGNGDDASKWVPIVWLFESNGYPADRLFAIRFVDPTGRSRFERLRHACSAANQIGESCTGGQQSRRDDDSQLHQKCRGSGGGITRDSGGRTESRRCDDG